MVFVNLKMCPELRDRIKVIAAKEKISMVAMVERWAKYYEDEEKFPLPKSAEEILRIKKVRDQMRKEAA